VKLMHFSDAEMLVPTGPVLDQRPDYKPHGLWVSDESEDSYGWRSWCEDNEYSLGRNAFGVKLLDTAEVLTLTKPESIRQFAEMFAALGDHMFINWGRVVETWQGILITPYQWSLRLSDLRWYYSWDCASGCIWDPSAIASVTRLSTKVVAP
jgi:hypothetical protein